MKKIVWVFIFALVVSFTVMAEEEDLINEEDLFEYSLYGESLKALGLIEGNGQGLNEGGPITREAFIKMLVLVSTDMTADFSLPEEPTFSDVSVDHWAYDWIERAYAAGLTQGVGNGKFGLGQEVTNQQVAAFMLNALGDTYDYSAAIQTAADRGIDTQVKDQFNRGNAFEMVHKTLLEVPFGQEVSLHATNKNFGDKNFSEIVKNLKEDRETKVNEARKEAEEKAAAEALRLEEEKMDKYLSTWPFNQEEYIAWMKDMNDMMEPYWEEMSVSDYRDKFSLSLFYEDAGFERDLYYVAVYRSGVCSVTIKSKTEDDRFREEKINMTDFKIYHVDKYGAYKIVGQNGDETMTFFFTVDKGEDLQRKGYFYYEDRLKLIRLGNHSLVHKMSEEGVPLARRIDEENFTQLFLDEFHAIVKENVSLEAISSERIEVGNLTYDHYVGFNQYIFYLQSMKQKGKDIYLDLSMASTGKVESLELDSLMINDQRDLITIMYNQTYGDITYIRFLLLSIDEEGKILKAYTVCADGRGIYVAE